MTTNDTLVGFGIPSPKQLREDAAKFTAEVRRLAGQATATHDVRDRRRTKMDGAIEAIQGCVADLTEFAGDPGAAYLVAGKLRRLAVELENFRARDLINQRKAQS